jgi:PAS domain S-box-containing protein
VQGSSSVFQLNSCAKIPPLRQAFSVVGYSKKNNKMTKNDIEQLLSECLLRSKNYSLVITDLEGRYIYVNEVFKKRFAFMNIDFIGQPFWITIHPEDVEKCNIASYQCITNPNETFGVQVRKPDNLAGDFYWTEWEFSLFKDHDKRPVGILCLGHDITETERASRQAKEFAQKVETIIEEITDGFYVLNREWEFVKMNKVTEQILGIPREKLLGHKIWDLFPDTPDYNYPAAYRKAMNEYITVTFEDYRADLDKWFSTVCYPSQEGLTVFFRDITQEKKTEDRLKYSENKLRAILDSTTDGNILISPDYKILCFNKQANEVSKLAFGKPLEELADMWNYVFPDDKEDFYKDTQKALKGEHLKFEREIIFEQFSAWFEVSYFPVYDTNGIILGVTFNTTNIDRRKQTEIKLKQSETMLRALYDSSSEANTFIDKNFSILFANKLAKEICKSIFGREPQIGDKCLDYIVPDLQAEFSDYYQRVLQGETIYVEKEHFGSWWRFSLFPVYDSENNIVGISDNVKDITARKENELKILKQNETLQQIAWQQSHEVRRPVANILGMYNLLKDDQTATEEEKQKYLDYLLQATKELDKIIHKIVIQANENEYGTNE